VAPGAKTIRGKTMAGGARAICSATVSFGLVSIPVKAYKTSSDDKVSFKMITKNGNGVKMQFRDVGTDEVVTKGECDSGYEIGDGKFVVFTDDELDSLAGAKNNYIEIVEVSDSVDLSPHHVEQALYLSPDGSEKAYSLLAKCLKATKRVAVCKWYSRGKDHLVAIAPVGKLLMMFKLYYATELRSLDVSINSEPSDKEVTLANKLLDQLHNKKQFNLSAYKDEVLERMRDAIAKKQNGEKLELVKPKADVGAFDLEALLAGSLKDDKVA
jgi:DNA end-binding protein Ku